MRLQAHQLADYLTRCFAPIWLVFGDESLLVAEATDAIRARARENGYTERVLLPVQAGFDWNALAQAGANLSLFGDRQLIELRLSSAKLAEAGAQALRRYAGAPPDTCTLLITAPKLESRAQKADWLEAIDKAGVVVAIRAVEAAQLPAWIEARMRAAGLQPTREAVTLIAERVEGNLLAAKQEIDKLQLLYGASAIGAEAVLSAVADSARFTIYDLPDAALQGDGARAARILQGLRAEGVEPPLALWALTRELRVLASLAHAQARGQPLEPILARNRVWDARKGTLKRGLQRHSVQGARGLLQQAAAVDRIVKGAAPGRPWDALLRLSLAVAGCDLLHRPVLSFFD
jgi:DNA polymerase III subunit delta